jgi:hypothetical protein
MCTLQIWFLNFSKHFPSCKEFFLKLHTLGPGDANEIINFGIPPPQITATIIQPTPFYNALYSVCVCVARRHT